MSPPGWLVVAAAVLAIAAGWCANAEAALTLVSATGVAERPEHAGPLKTVAAEHTENGSWSTWPETRPPIFGSSDESLTVLATLAVLPVAAAGDDGFLGEQNFFAGLAAQYCAADAAGLEDQPVGGGGGDDPQVRPGADLLPQARENGLPFDTRVRRRQGAVDPVDRGGLVQADRHEVSSHAAHNSDGPRSRLAR